MKLKPSYLLRNFDWISFITIIILSAISLIMLYSIALGSDDPTDMLNFQKQIIFVFLGIILYLGIAFFVDYKVLFQSAGWLYVFGAALLGAVLVFGQNIRGTTGWFDLGIVSLQPVEFVKIVAIIFLAKYLTAKAKFIHQLRYLIASAAGIVLLVFLVLMQPDFGSAVILLALWLGLVVVTGIRWSHFMVLVLGVLSSLAIMWLFLFQEFQKNRILVFLDPTRDPLGVGYNVTQAIIAVGSGQLFGRGLSFGSQSKLKFLPEAQTDFIFAVISEQLGFLGVLMMLALFGILLWRLVAIAKASRDNFSIFVVLGVLFVLFVQVVINISMNLGLMPVTGLTLPLISYGGSSYLATMIMLGVVQSIAMRTK